MEFALDPAIRKAVGARAVIFTVLSALFALAAAGGLPFAVLPAAGPSVLRRSARAAELHAPLVTRGSSEVMFDATNAHALRQALAAYQASSRTTVED